MFTNSVVHPTFFESARDAAWKTIKELGDRVKCRMINLQSDLKDEKKHTPRVGSYQPNLKRRYYRLSDGIM